MNKIKIIIITCMNLTFIYAQWEHTSAPPYPVITLAASGNYVFAGIYGGLVYRSADNGDTWNSVTLPSSGNGDALVSAFGNRVIAGFKYGGLFCSTDNGVTWSNVEAGIPPGPYIRVVYATQNSLLVYKEPHYPYDGGLFVSTNNGMNWMMNPFQVSALTAELNTVFAGAYPPSIIESSNSGLNWTATSASLPGVISSVSFGIGYILAPVISGGSSNGIYKSTDNGNSWAPANSGLPQTPYVTSLLKYGPYNFAGLDMDSGGVYITSNNGNDWVNTNLNSTAIYALTQNNTFIFAGSHAGDGVWRMHLPGTTGISSNNNQMPDSYSLSQNYPNPFNPSTKISYDLPSAVNVKLVVYDMLGRVVKTLVNEKQNAGNHEIEFDASNYPSGVYFYKLITNSFTESKKMVLTK